MRSGLKTLHEIDKAIVKARHAVSEASEIPRRTTQSLMEIRRQQTAAYDEIAKARLGLLQDGDGGALGYVDRKAQKLLADHQKDLVKIETNLDKQVAKVEAIETERRRLEKAMNDAIDAYDKAAAIAEKEIIKDPDYIHVLNQVKAAEDTVFRAGEKLELARANESEKGAPYRNDPFFTYLQKRQYGTKQAKGWFLTKWLDSWVASLINYPQTAEDYRRLQAIPQRLAVHVESLEDKVLARRDELEALEAQILEEKGVTSLHKTSIKAQESLEKTDTNLAESERVYEELRAEHHKHLSGEKGPFKEAVSLISDALTRIKASDLRRIAAQTRDPSDDHAVQDLRDLARTADELEDDQKEARDLVRKYEKTLKDLEKIRRKFKSRRYDAPSSVFDGELVGALLLRVLAGALDGDSLWRQIERAQRTIRRYSDNDFGGIDWTEGLRLPRTQKRRRSPRIRTSIPRSPRTSLPKIRLPKSGGRSGGFRTGGGF